MTTPTLAPEVLRAAVQGDPFWEDQIRLVTAPADRPVALHLAILVNPYLQLVLDGQKTIESRFSINRRAPYAKVQQGDVVLFKQSGGPILGIGAVEESLFYQLTPETLQKIRTKFAQELCVDDPAFWANRASAAFATLLRLQHVRSISPITYTKRDQRAWVILQSRTNQPSFWRDQYLHIHQE